MIVTPLIGTGVTPNHLTTLRLATGLAACATVALGTPKGALWGGVLWLVSAFLDRADGELARVGDMKSAAGHAYDYISDVVVNSLLFAGAGIGARHGWLGAWAPAFGLVATAAMLVAWVVAERYERLDGSGQKPYPSFWGFDIDDGLYLIAPLIWWGLMGFVVVGAALGTTVMAAVIVIRYRRLLARRALAG